MVGAQYWSTGITFQEFGRSGEYSVWCDFYDDGFATPESTEGRLDVRYVTKDLTHAIDTLKEDAERLGLRWGGDSIGPTVFVKDDGATEEDGDRPELRRLANEHARRLGWHATYRRVS